MSNEHGCHYHVPITGYGQFWLLVKCFWLRSELNMFIYTKYLCQCWPCRSLWVGLRQSNLIKCKSWVFVKSLYWCIICNELYLFPPPDVWWPSENLECCCKHRYGLLFSFKACYKPFTTHGKFTDLFETCLATFYGFKLFSTLHYKQGRFIEQ